ncbi:MAG: AAA family ATPase [bacterium]|nr:AAA family ATPase [bacterium]
MNKIADYEILDKIDETRKSIVFRGKKENESKTVIIKLLKESYPSLVDIARYKHEYEILSNVDIEGIVRTFNIINSDSGIGIILEDFGGISLKRILEKDKLTIDYFLKTGIKIAGILGKLHEANIIHNDIKPANILINEQTGILKLADFGITRILTHKDDDIYNPAVIEGSLVYMSPEQTGRMNRGIDYRSDLYSLGISFYEMLTGTVPFRSIDPMELIYSHIAKEAAAPHVIVPRIPVIISRIVMKLLSKSAAERYQNGFCLMTDLKECLGQLEKEGSLEGFDETFYLAQNDIPIKFYLPHVLVGRAEEMGILFEAFDRVSSGAKEMILVSGRPGIGKSFLINEINKPIVAVKGYFISGKYNQFENIPYNSLIQAFQGLIGQILIESRESLDSWRKKLLKALGPNGKVITEIIPGLEFIIGEQPEIPVLGPEESDNRFNLVFKNFINVFAHRDHPLVLFLDDLQWAGLDDLNLIETIEKDRALRYFLIIGAYRDTEVTGSHPLMHMLNEIEKDDIQVTHLTLDSLNEENVNILISYYLRCKEEESSSLSALVYKKTRGNPFFVNQFVKRLYEEGLLELDSSSGWKWEIEKIQQLQVTENVVEFISKKITALSETAQDILKICACLGDRFDLETLLLVSCQSTEYLLLGLKSAVDENLFIVKENKYRFSHDRIQEAAYSLIPESEKANLHYSIGQTIIGNISDEEFHNNFLYIVNQLNFGISLELSGDEKENLARLNFKAGIRAKTSTAYEPALIYLRTGIELLEGDCWEKQYDLALSLYQEAVEAAYLATRYDEMDLLSEQILEHGRGILDKVKVYEITALAFFGQNRLQEATDTGLEILKFLGVHFPKETRMHHILFNFLKTALTLHRARKKSLTNLPEMKDEKMLAVMRILSGITSTAYLSASELFSLIIFKMIRLSIKYGNAEFSPFSYSTYGIVLCSISQIEMGYRFGRFAIDLQKKMDIKRQKARTHFTVYSFIAHWKDHVRDTLKPLLQAYRDGLETGDLEYAAFSLQVYCYHGLLAGINLEIVERNMVKYINILDSLKQENQFRMTQLYYQVTLNLMGKVSDPCFLKGEGYDEEKMLPVYLAAEDRTSLCLLYLFKMQLNYFFEKYPEALDYAHKVAKEINGMRGSFFVPLFYFYDSLIRLAVYAIVPAKVLKNQAKMKKWAAHAPMNHLHKYQLVEAEIARVKRKDSRAMKYYEKAITGAHDNGFIQEEALAGECAARFYLERGLGRIGNTSLSGAINCYSRWGAAAKVKFLKKKYPENLSKEKDAEILDSIKETGSTTTFTKASDQLDLSTVIAASQTLSAEMDLKRLLETIIKIAVENAGAQKGLLLLNNPKDNRLYIEAVFEAGEITVLQKIPLDEYDDIPHSIINYVYRTGEDFVLHDARIRGIFVDDPYVIRKQSRSILCALATYRGTMAGILYLENNLAANAFTPERLKLVSILSSQCAISIKNTGLILTEKQNAVLEKEIEMARTIQQALLPGDPPALENAVVALKYVPMMGVGGDFVDICYDKDSNKLGLFICDVSGHGVPAAITASIVSMSLDFFWNRFIGSPARLLREMRTPLKNKLAGNFFTACVGCLDLEEGILTLATAGHPPCILVRKSGTVEMVMTTGRFIYDLFEPNSEDQWVQLQKGDRAVLYTDGITEANDHNGSMLGANDDEKFCAWVKEISDASASPSLLCQNIYNKVMEYTGKETLEDDFTILVVEYTGDG